MRRMFTLMASFLALVACQQTKLEAPKINHFTVSPTSLPSGGGNVTLDWDVSGAASLSVDQGVGAITPADKGTKVVNVTSSKSFTLTATNSTGSINAPVVNVTVAVAPSISLSPTSRTFVTGNPGGVFDANVQGSSATVNWAIDGPGSLSSATGPSVIYTPPATIPNLSTVTLTASLEGTALSATATISVAPEVLTGGVLFYKTDGSGTVASLSADGTYTSVKPYAAGELPYGITHFGKPYDLYELMYDSADGSGALGSFNGAGEFKRLRSYAANALPVGQSHMVSLSDRLVFFKAGTSICGTYGSSNYDYTIQKTTPGFAPNWTLILPTINGVLFYRTGGVGAFGNFDANCKWTQITTYNGFSPDWTSLVNTPNGVLFYRKTDGAGALVAFAANGAPTQTGTFLSPILKKWEQVINTKSGVLFYNADGSGELGTVKGNTYTLVKAYAAGELPANADLIAAVGN